MDCQLDLLVPTYLYLELAKGRSGIVRRYLDAKIEFLSDPEEGHDDSLKPFADRLLQFAWTARKIVDVDKKLALACFEDGIELATLNGLGPIFARRANSERPPIQTGVMQFLNSQNPDSNPFSNG